MMAEYKGWKIRVRWANWQEGSGWEPFSTWAIGVVVMEYSDGSVRFWVSDMVGLNGSAVEGQGEGDT